MKYLLVVLSVSVSVLSYSQKAMIKTEDKKVEVMINAISDVTLFTDKGNFELKKIESIVFAARNPVEENLYQKLRSKGIQVAFNNGEEVFTTPVIDTSAKPTDVTVQELNNRILAFANQRQTGKGLQVVGTLIAVVGLIAIDDPDNASLVAAGGLGLAVVGYGVDIGAGKRLKGN